MPFYFPALWVYVNGDFEKILEYDREDTVEHFKQFLIDAKVEW